MTVSKIEASRWGGRGWALLILGLSLMVSGLGTELSIEKFEFKGVTFTLPIIIAGVGLLCLAAEPLGHIISKTKWGKK